jgi:hypothetical protein
MYQEDEEKTATLSTFMMSLTCEWNQIRNSPLTEDQHECILHGEWRHDCCPDNKR